MVSEAQIKSLVNAVRAGNATTFPRKSFWAKFGKFERKLGKI